MKKQIIISLCLGMMALFATPALAQNQKVTGTVVDDKGEPIIGASVMVAGEKGKGTVTDLDGNYSLEMPANGKVTISYIGYIPQTVKPGGTVKLQEDSQSLEEVVVVGYGVQKMKNVTGAVTTVDTKEMADLSTGSLGESLQGLVNGLGVSTGSRPGEQASLTIRQAKVSLGSGSTVDTNASPLYVIDDFISTEEAFNNLDASVIDQISVLKDASAAVYGARAANGVILVKTKRGQNSAPKVSYSGQFGWTGRVKSTKMVNAYDYARLYNGVVGAMPTGSKVNNYDRLTDVFQLDELNAMAGMDYDLVDKYWKTAFTHKHSVNVSGGSDRATYFASIGYFDQDGNLGNIDYKRWNYRAGTDIKLNKWFKVSMQISGDVGDKKNTNNKIGGSSSGDYYSLMSRPRYIPDYLGDLPMAMYGPSNTEDSSWQRYNYEALQRLGNRTENHSSNMTINTSIEHDFGWLEPLKGLKLKFTYSRAENNTKSNEIGTVLTTYKMNNRGGSGMHLYAGNSTFDALQIGNGGNGDGYLRRHTINSNNYQMNLTLNYNRKFGNHDIGAVFSIEKSEAESEYVWGSMTKPLSITDGQSKTTNNGTPTTEFGRSESGTLSYIFRANYAYMDKYLFEFLLRTDASTKFAPENYWGTFPSVSAGWVMSEENWFKKAFPWIDFFKIRASFGLLGRDNIQPWKWLQLYNIDNKVGGVFGTGIGNRMTQGVQMSDAPNRDAHWDKSYKWNAGIDARFLSGRLSVGIDGYYEAMRDILTSRSQSATYPGTVGTKPSAENYGAVNLWGIELSLGWRDQIGKDFKYHVKLNTGYSDNKVKEWFLSNDTYYSQHLNERMLESTWGLQCLGMFRSYQQIEEYFKQYNITSYLGLSKDQVRPGMLIYKDVRGPKQPDGSYAAPDGKIDKENDLVELANRRNPYSVTLNFGGEWKNLSFSAQLHATWGGYSFVDTNARGAKNIISGNTGIKALEYTNVPSFWANDMFVYEDVVDAAGNVVCPANQGAKYPNMAYSINTETSSFWRVSGTRITLRNITVAYTLPKDIVKKLGLSSVRFNVTGQNMLSLYNPYPDNFIDPMDSYGAYPTLRKVTLGVNIGF